MNDKIQLLTLFNKVELHYHIRMTKGHLVFKTMSINDLLSGKLDDYIFEGFDEYKQFPIFRKN
jgi:hypothetical protein